VICEWILASLQLSQTSVLLLLRLCGLLGCWVLHALPGLPCLPTVARCFAQKLHMNRCILGLVLALATRTLALSIYFAHVHKSGGSTVCQVAKAGGMNVTAGNCNAASSRMRQVLKNGSAVEQRVVFGELKHLDLLANEEGLPDYPYYPPNVSLLTIIRDPIERFYSQFLHAQSRLLRGAGAAELDRDPALRGRFLHPKQHPPSFTDFLLSNSQPEGAFRDNFLIRYFAGHSARSKPEGKLVIADFCSALCHIYDFDEILNFSAAFSSPLAQALGVSSHGAATLNRAGTRNNAGNHITQKLPLALMHSKSTFDYELIECVRSVNACRIKFDTNAYCWPVKWQAKCDHAACAPRKR